MKLIKYKIGDIIELFDQKCNIHNLTKNEVSGINKEKEFFEPSIQVGSNTSDYKIVPPGYFACNLMHVGRDVVLPIALNRTIKNKIVSPAYTVFKIKNETIILKKYFFLLINSSEKDRYFWFNCDSSIRDGMEWDRFCDIEIELPPLDVQKKYVVIYENLLFNLHSYEKGLDNLKLVCDGYIEKIRKFNKPVPIIDFLQERCETNTFCFEGLELKGVGLKGFIKPNQMRSDESLKKCNIFYENDFVYAPSSFKNGVIAFNDIYSKALCSEEYVVFKIKDSNKLNPYYLLMWLKRNELGRFIDFYVLDSVRNRFYFNNFEIIAIPIPSIEIQNNISEIYKNYQNNLSNVNKLKQIIKEICPILIKGSIEETRRL